jgi:hypothetical protein
MSNSVSRVATLFSLIALVTACGGGGGGNGLTGPTYSGNESSTAVTSTNSQSIGTAVTDSASQTVGTSNSMTAFGVVVNGGGSIPTDELNQLVVDITKNSADGVQSSSSPAGAVITSDQLTATTGSFCGGSITVPDNFDPNSPTMDITVTFTNLCYNDTTQQMYFNGSVRLIQTETSFSMVYANFSVTINSVEVLAINASVNCDVNGNACSVDYVGLDGATYRMASLSLTGDNSSGYFVSATFFHPDFGSVDVTTANQLLFNCGDQPQPSSGKLVFVGSSNTAGSIEFQGCSSYQYCYDDDTTDGILTTATCSNTVNW